MGKLEENKKLKQEALFNSAFELFTTKGLNRTTITDIVDNAGVAKGTFYLYFEDKYDIYNQLIAHKTNEVFFKANQALKKTHLQDFREQLHFVIDFALIYLEKDQPLLSFISKNLDCGTARISFTEKSADISYNFYQDYLNRLSEDTCIYRTPELMLFTIIELVSSTCYGCILYQDPVPMQEYKPHLHHVIDAIMDSFMEIPSHI